LLRYSIAWESVGYHHYWRQIPYSQLEQLDLNNFLNKCVDNTFYLLYKLATDKAVLLSPPKNPTQEEMISQLKGNIKINQSLSYKFDVMWWNQRYDPMMTDHIDFLLDDRIIIVLRVSNLLNQDSLFISHLFSSILYEQTQRKNIETMVLIPNLAAVYDSSFKNEPIVKDINYEKEFLFRILRRKALLPFDKEELIKCKSFLSGQQPIIRQTHQCSKNTGLHQTII